jgi:sugar-specific transcriptional regulator TrmB
MTAKQKERKWVHGLELDGLTENNIPFAILNREGADNYLIEVCNENKGEITIEVKTLITPQAYEELEDKLRNFLEKEGLNAIIEDNITGNTTTTR